MPKTFCQKLKKIHVVLDNTEELIHSIYDRECVLAEIAEQLQLEFMIYKLANKYVESLVNSIIQSASNIKGNKIRSVAEKICLLRNSEILTNDKNDFDKNNLAESCHEFFETKTDLIVIESISLYNYGYAINVVTKIPIFKALEAKLYKVHSIPTPLGKVNNIHTFTRYENLPNYIIDVFEIEQILAANDCFLTSKRLFCTTDILYLYSKYSSCAGSIFHENVTNKFLDDIKKACKPKEISVKGDFNPRGGIKTQVFTGDNI